MINAMVDHLGDTRTALGAPTGRRVVGLLQQGPRRASELADGAGMSRRATSRHLKVLRASGLVDVALDDDDGRSRVYRLRPDRLVALRAWLDQVQAGHPRQLAAFKRHAQREGGTS